MNSDTLLDATKQSSLSYADYGTAGFSGKLVTLLDYMASKPAKP
jgi:hypothetical protein